MKHVLLTGQLLAYFAWNRWHTTQKVIRIRPKGEKQKYRHPDQMPLAFLIVIDARRKPAMNFSEFPLTILL